jgi:8-amino-7-oxononanoate synthase
MSARRLRDGKIPAELPPPDLTIEGMVRERYNGQDDRDVFSKTAEFTLMEQARTAQLYPFFQPLDNNDGPEARIYGRRVLMFGSNNYLGLTRHPYVIEKAREAIATYGTSMTGSRLLNGSIHLHEELEGRIARFLGKEAALVFTTGYQANLGAISSLVSRHSIAILDRADHASIYDGCRLGDGGMVRFKHNDPADLEAVLSRVDSTKACMVITDGVFSMGGDIAHLPQLAEVCRRYHARLLVDDAHAIGVIGQGGRGTGSHFGIPQEVDLVVGTFSKSLASIGGFVAGPKQVMEWIRHFARPMMFSASLPPASTAAALAALDVLESEPERVLRLQKLGLQWREGLQGLGFSVGESQTAIVPVNIGNEYRTVKFWKLLLEKGVYTNPVFYPAVPKGKALLRTSCMATHTPEQIGQALEQFRTVGREHGVIP